MKGLLGALLVNFGWYRRRQGGVWYRVRTTMHPQIEEWTREIGTGDVVLRTEHHGQDSGRLAKEEAGRAA